MDDLPRLIDDPEGSALGRALIASSRGDAPSEDARARAARRLGIAAVLAAGASAGSEAGALAGAGKLVVVLLALGGVVGLAMRQTPGHVHRVSEVSPSPARASSPTATAAASARVANPSDSPASASGPTTTVESPASASAPSQSLPSTSGRSDSTAVTSGPSATAVVPPPSGPSATAVVSRGSAANPTAAAAASTRIAATPPRPAPARRAPPADVTPAAPPPAVPEIAAAPAPDTPAPEPTGVVPLPEPATAAEIPAGPSRLAAEVALLDRARAGLAAGEYPAALAALAEYRRRFPHGDLDAEAQMVMIEVVIAQRDLPRARSLGTEFLARFPRSPLAQRVRSLLDRLPK